MHGIKVGNLSSIKLPRQIAIVSRPDELKARSFWRKKHMKKISKDVSLVLIPRTLRLDSSVPPRVAD